MGKSTPFEDYGDRRLPREMQARRLERAIRQELTRNQREILLAYYIQELSIPQIAAQRGVNKSTVSRTLHRAEEKLKRLLRL